MAHRDIDNLKRLAGIAAEMRGHILERWVTWPTIRAYRGSICCAVCGRQINIVTNPLPLEGHISGTALHIDCKED